MTGVQTCALPILGYDAPLENPGNVHHTLGGPYYNELRDTAFAEEWFAEQANMLHVAQRANKS